MLHGIVRANRVAASLTISSKHRAGSTGTRYGRLSSTSGIRYKFFGGYPFHLVSGAALDNQGKICMYP